jgi:hypothetical protein
VDDVMVDMIPTEEEATMTPPQGLFSNIATRRSLTTTSGHVRMVLAEKQELQE